MRFVRVSVPSRKRAVILSVLDEEEIEYDVTSGPTERHETVIAFPLPTDIVGPTLDRLRGVGADEEGCIVVLDTRTVIPHDEQLRARRAEQDDQDGRIARDELQAAAAALAPERSKRWSYAVMTAVSAIVAVVGLLQNSAAVIVGSMVIAPLIGPAMAAAVGTVIADRELTTRGVALQVFGVILAIVSAAVFALFIKTIGLVPPGTDITSIPEIRSRLTPDFLSLAVALGAGVAGAISLVTGSGVALVGVMIAVALIPPAATVGIGIAWSQPIVSLGSGVLVLVNVLSINLTALIVLRVLGYRPQDVHQLDMVRIRIARRVRVLALALVVLSIFLAGVTYLSYQTEQFEQQTNGEIRELLDEQPYRKLALLDASIETSQAAIALDQAGFTTGEPIRVTVSVDRPIGTNYPQLAASIDRRLTRITARDVIVEVQFIDVDRTTAEQPRTRTSDSNAHYRFRH